MSSTIPGPAVEVDGPQPNFILYSSESVIGYTFAMVWFYDPFFPLNDDTFRVTQAPMYGNLVLFTSSGSETLSAGETVSLAGFASLDYEITSIPVSVVHPDQTDVFSLVTSNPAHTNNAQPVYLDFV